MKAALRSVVYSSVSPCGSPYKRSIHLIRVAAALHVAAVLALACAASCWGQSKTATTTSMTLTSGGSAVSSISAASVVVLTATVKAGANAVTPGQVNFCDASATSCTDVHLLGVAQLTSAGTATLKLRPGIGSHSYRAVFAGTVGFASSTSGTLSVSVSGGVLPSLTTIAQSGLPGNYSLTANVIGSSKHAIGPTGNVSFLNTSTSNAVIATAALSNAVAFPLVNAFNPAVGNEPRGLVSGDFNGDGNLDLAVGINSATVAATIMLGDGSGNFAAANSSISGAGSPVLVQDFNGDGKPDLLLTSNLAGSIRILLGNGDGTFTEAAGSPFSTNYGSGPLVAGDFNDDGIPDLVIAGGYYLVTLLGNGDGTFSAVPIGSSTPTQADLFSSIAAADLNGDGFTDLVIADLALGTLDVYLSNGDGTFTKASGTAQGLNSATQIALGDFNGDGKLDVALALYGGSNEVGILLGNGDGTFQSPSTASVVIGTAPFVLAVGDFNADGKADLFLGAQVNGTTIGILTGNGDGTFTQASIGSAELPCCSTAAFGDFNGDGATDVASSSFYDGSAAVMLGNMSEATATVNNIAVTGPGDNMVISSYPGDQNYLPSSSDAISLQSVVADPVFSLTSGGYTSVETITITDATPGATIYYSGFGALNTNGFVPYTGPITLSTPGSEQIEAYATETGFLSSNYVTANYTIYLPQTAAPTISLAAGYYSGAQTVTITDSDPSAKIYYTTNGGLPYLNANLYTGPITVSSSETLVAIAVSDAHSDSPVVSAQYVIGSSTAAMIYSIAGSGPLYGYSGDGGPATLSQIDAPYSVVKDASGNVFFSDQGNHMVREIAAGTGIITVVAGNGYHGNSGDGGPATSAELGYPTSLALDNGSLFIGDGAYNRVRRVDLSSGTITTYAGDGSGAGSGDGGPATAAGIGTVSGLAVDAFHNLYIAEGYNAAIRQVNGGTGIISTVAGTGFPGYSGDGGPAINATFGAVYGLAFDSAGNLYIADPPDDIVRKIAATNGVIGPTSIISTVAGTPPSSQWAPYPGYSGDGGPATSAKLYSPTAVALDTSGNLFIADESNSAIREVTASNGNISTIAGSGSCTLLGGDGGAAASSALCYPVGITVDSSGNIVIADQSNNRIREIIPAAAPPASRASAPTFSVAAGNYAGPQTVTITDTTPGASIYVTVDGSTPTTASAGYSLPINVGGTVTIKAIAAAPGYLNSPVASATYNISSFSPLISTVAGFGGFGFVATPGPALSMFFTSPKGVAFDKAGNLYVSDSGNNVIWIIAPSGTASIFAGTGVAGLSGDGGPASNATLYAPAGLAFDSVGNLYIADSGNNVVREIAASTGVISTVAGVGSHAGWTGDGGPATSATLSQPSVVAFDGANNLYIADTYNYRIREVSAATGIITTVAGIGSSQGNTGDGGLATNAGLLPPDCLAVDKSGNIFVASSNGATVRKVTAATGIIGTVAGLKDLAGQIFDDGPALGAEVSPRALALDAAGNLYISNAPGEIREINAATGVITRVAGIGYPGYSGDGGAAAVAQIYYPAQIAFDSAGSLYFADGMERIRKVALSAQQTATPTFSPAGGSYASTQTVTISDATSGATIYYTTDGTAPTSSSSVYSNPISVNATETIKAVAMAGGYSQSAIGSATYTISLPAPTFTIASTAVTVTKGATTGNTSTITVQPSNGFTGSVTLTASVTSSPNGAQYVPKVSFGATSPLSITGSTEGVATLTISTTAATTTANHSGSSLWLSEGGFTLALAILVIPARRRNWKIMLASAGLLVVLGSLGACGGGGGNQGGNGGGGGTSIAGTTSGAYVITVTGTSGSISQTGTVSLTVR